MGSCQEYLQPRTGLQDEASTVPNNLIYTVYSSTPSFTMIPHFGNIDRPLFGGLICIIIYTGHTLPLDSIGPTLDHLTNIWLRLD
jgi:hypothetical protein